jgi:hypothetical protein
MTNQEKDPKTAKKSPLKESISERLESLNADPRRSQIGLLAENLVAIEKALSRGIPRVVVWEGLREEGLTLTFLSFETCLQRLRKRKAAQGTSQAPQPTTSQSLSQPSAKPISSAAVSVGSSGSEQEAEDLKLVAFKKSIAHLSVVQRAKKISDYHEQEERNRMSPLVQKILDKGKNK